MELQPIDWLTWENVCLLRAIYHADPLEWTLEQFGEYLAQAGFVKRVIAGEVTTEERLERESFEKLHIRGWHGTQH